ncbi:MULTISPECIES: hypothetical protein [Aphanothece]|uniref:hypothetical protein n=1 Tax=Aphanothece TaxID=1121 RepID=UPI00398F319E
MALLRLLLLPFRAPMLLLLAAVSVYEGMQWSRPASAAAAELAQLSSLFWSLDLLHALLVVVVCTLFDLLLKQLANLMAASRVVSLVVTLLLVTVGGLYLLDLKVLTNLLILACAVLLARLDLARVRVSPPPLVLAVSMSTLVLLGAGFGRWLAWEASG